MKQFAVMGNPIAHSLSPVIHQQFAKEFGIDLRYQKLLITKDNFEQQVTDFFAKGGSGLNITLPFKNRAYILADKATTRCQKAKAANVLWLDDGVLTADNTDGVGFMRDIKQKTSLTDKKVLIIGAGGAAQGIIAPLLDSNIYSLTLTNRSLDKAYTLQRLFPKLIIQALAALKTHDLVINATSVNCDFFQEILPNITHSNSFCYDLNYQLAGPTPFIYQAKNHGCLTSDGLGMLVEQAAEAFFIWHRYYPNINLVKTCFKI